MAATLRFRNLIRSVRSEGIGSSAKAYWSRIRERFDETRLGIDSDQIIGLDKLALACEERRDHVPTKFRDFRAMKAAFRPTSQSEVFVDYGAGLGRMVVLAATLPFKKVIGIEISEQLAGRARDNVRQCRAKLQCRDIEIFTIDATKFEAPPEVTTIFFYNPFVGSILSDVLRNIRHSYDTRPRRLRIFCSVPDGGAFDSQIRKVEWLRLEKTIKLGDNSSCLIFAVK